MAFFKKAEDIRSETELRKLEMDKQHFLEGTEAIKDLTSLRRMVSSIDQLAMEFQKKYPEANISLPDYNGFEFSEGATTISKNGQQVYPLSLSVELSDKEIASLREDGIAVTVTDDGVNKTATINLDGIDNYEQFADNHPETVQAMSSFFTRDMISDASNLKHDMGKIAVKFADELNRKGNFIELSDKVKSGVQNGIDKVQSGIQTGVENIKENVGARVESAKQTATEAIDRAKKFNVEAGQAIEDTVRDGAEAVATGVKTAGKAVAAGTITLGKMLGDGAVALGQGTKDLAINVRDTFLKMPEFIAGEKAANEMFKKLDQWDREIGKMQYEARRTPDGKGGMLITENDEIDKAMTSMREEIRAAKQEMKDNGWNERVYLKVKHFVDRAADTWHKVTDKIMDKITSAFKDVKDNLVKPINGVIANYAESKAPELVGRINEWQKIAENQLNALTKFVTEHFAPKVYDVESGEVKYGAEAKMILMAQKMDAARNDLDNAKSIIADEKFQSPYKELKAGKESKEKIEIEVGE